LLTRLGEDARVDQVLLAGLSDEHRQALLRVARRRRFGRREVIFHEGDPGDALHLVVSGHVGIRMTTPMGDVAMVRVVGAGEFFGELALLSPGPRSASAIALEAAETMTLHRDHFDELRRSSPAAQGALTAALAVEVRRLAAALLDAMYLPVEKRVWRRLLQTVATYEDGTLRHEIPLSQ
jgi:CRP-like cAMP-binding protein